LIERQPDIAVVGEAEDAEECLKKFEQAHPDIVVMDIKLAGLSGIEACQQLKAAHPEAKVIMLSMYDDYEYVDRALQAGADGYLLKKAVSSQLVDAIRKVAVGERAFSPQVLDVILSSRQGPDRHRPVPPMQRLTAREQEVLKLVSDGLRNKQIAAHLCVSPKTVEKVVSDIYHKLDVSSRAAAIKVFLDARPSS
jgi:DNA-binding NarL/FixJ family response regulator